MLAALVSVMLFLAILIKDLVIIHGAVFVLFPARFSLSFMLSLFEALLCFVDGGIVNIWGVQVVSFGVVVGGGAAAADDAPKREWCR